jgi:hypothetical protein
MSTSSINRHSVGYVHLSWKNRLKLIRVALSFACVGVVRSHYIETLVLKEDLAESEKSSPQEGVKGWDMDWYGELDAIAYWMSRGLAWSCLIAGGLALNPVTVILASLCIYFFKRKCNQGAMLRVEFGKTEYDPE